MPQRPNQTLAPVTPFSPRRSPVNRGGRVSGSLHRCGKGDSGRVSTAPNPTGSQCQVRPARFAPDGARPWLARARQSTAGQRRGPAPPCPWRLQLRVQARLPVQGRWLGLWNALHSAWGRRSCWCFLFSAHRATRCSGEMKWQTLGGHAGQPQARPMGRAAVTSQAPAALRPGLLPVTSQPWDPGRGLSL